MTTQLTRHVIRRHVSGSPLVIGTAPLNIGTGGVLAGEQISDEVANILYIGLGNDGNGNATSIAAFAGSGAFVSNAKIGVASGVASLDATGKLPASQLTASIMGANVYAGVWNAATNTPTLVSGTGTKGAYYKVSVAGTTSIDGNANWSIGDMIIFDGATWDKLDGPAEAVISVAGRIGAIILSSTDISDWGTVTAAFASKVVVSNVSTSLTAVSSSLSANVAMDMNISASLNNVSSSLSTNVAMDLNISGSLNNMSSSLSNTAATQTNVSSSLSSFATTQSNLSASLSTLAIPPSVIDGGVI